LKISTFQQKKVRYFQAAPFFLLDASHDMTYIKSINVDQCFCLVAVKQFLYQGIERLKLIFKGNISSGKVQSINYV
jgi:hypothetical protein